MQKVTLPKFSITGGCQCGKVRYTLKAPPLTLYCCHCTECQRQSSSAFGMSMRVRRDDVEVAGETASIARQGASGSKLIGAFCPSCGVRLIHRREAYGTHVSLKAGTLDDTSWLVPAGHIWTQSKQKWVLIGGSGVNYAGQPDDFSALVERWREMTFPTSSAPDEQQH
jgi:hypothetical protein